MTLEDDLLRQRREKLAALEARGIYAYGRRYPRTGPIARAVSALADSGAAESSEEHRFAGRLVAYRSHGKSTFIDLRDESGKVQVYFKLDALGEEAYEVVGLLDLGDIIGVRGTLFTTRTGEITLRAAEMSVLSKSLRPLPEKWHGLRDQEIRFRRRYLDLIVNERSREVFCARGAVIASLRSTLASRGFTEVETPLLHPIAGGAHGRPFVTHADTLDMDLYLRIAPELYLKRLLVGGMERVYELGRSFRNEGLSPRHNTEFTMLEAYAAYCDYTDMMELCEALVCGAAEAVCGSLRVEFGGTQVDLTPPWRRVTFAEALHQAHGVDVAGGTVEELTAALKAAGVRIEGQALSRTRLLNLLAESISPTQPTFITDYPAPLCPLAKTSEADPLVAERFELFVAGMELANAYSELNDPLAQLANFRAQAAGEHGEAEDEVPPEVDTEYVTALEHGMPPAGGLGVGVDRLVMLLTDTDSIREVILFPQLRPEAGAPDVHPIAEADKAEA